MTITAGANAWRNVEGVMEGKRTPHKRKGNVLSSYVTPASTNVLETMILTGEVPRLRKKQRGKNNRGSNES